MTHSSSRPARWLAVALVTVGLAPAATAAAPATAPLRCDGEVATIVGTAGKDRIDGTPRADVIVALGGRDLVDGRGGDDRICGGPGADVVVGGPGDDRLFGQGNQWYADRGGVHVFGDVLDGGAGDDLLDVGSAPPGDYRSGERVEFLTAPGAVHVDLAAGTATGQGDDIVRVVAGLSVRTGDGDDTILGTPRADKVDAGPGHDVVTLFRGRDTFFERHTSLPDDDVVDTGGGLDMVTIASGADRVSTGTGPDDVGVRGRGPHVVDTGPGPDVVSARTSDVPGSSYDLGSGSGNYFSLEPGVRRGAGGVLPVRIDVPAGLFTITFPEGPVSARISGIEEFVLGKEFRIDFLGGDADETLFLAPVGSIPLRAVMGGGDDHVWGSRGDDYIDGGDGHDTASGDDGDDTCVQVEERISC